MTQNAAAQPSAKGEVVLTKQKNISSRLVSLLWLSLLSTAVVFGLYYAFLYAFNVFPFSQKAPSQYDLLAQIVPFAEHFFDVLQGKASLFYSYRLAGGMDVFGTVAYCMLSPFSFIFWLFGEGNVWYAASFMIPVKLSCIALSALVMIKIKFADMHDLIALLVALLYAFCGYTFVANTYINWMDFLIWMPLFVPAFDALTKKGKILPMTLLLAVCIFTCFSIACFSMLVSYPILVLYAVTVVEKGKRKGYITKLSLCYLCGILLAFPLMLPALMSYLASGRNTGFFDSLWNDFSTLSYYRKFSYIVSDAFFLVCIVIYFCKTHFASKESRFLALAGLIVMMPVLVDECCILLNMGSYMSYALRFGFLNALFELYVSCLVLQQIRFDRKTVFALQREKQALLSPMIAQKKKKTGALPVALGALLVGLTALAIVGIFEVFTVTRNMNGLNFEFWPWLSSTIASAKELSSGFAGSFAHSTGALEGVCIVGSIVAIFCLAIYLFYQGRLAPMKLLYPCLAAVVLANVAFYGSTLVSGNVFNHVRYDEYDSLYQTVMKKEELPDHQFRVKDYGAYISDNQSLITKTNAYSVFSSVTDQTNFAFKRVFNMGGNGINTLKSRNGTLLADCLIGHKYVFFQSEQKGENRPSLKRDYLTEVASEENFILYENTCVFPSAFTVGGEDMGVVDEYDRYFENMQNLYAFLGGEGEVFTTYALRDSDVRKVTVTDEKTKEQAEVFHVKIYLPKSGDYSFFAGALADNTSARYYTGSYSQENLKPLSSVKTFTYHNAAPGNYYSLYLYDESGSLTENEIIEKCAVKCMEKDTVQALSEKLWQRKVDYDLTSDLFTTSFTANVPSANKGEKLFINYVALQGHTATVNGKKVDLRQNGLNMLVVPLEEGANEVVIEYRSPYVSYATVGAALSVGLLLLIAFLIHGKRGKKVLAAVELPVTVAAVVLVVAVVGVFMLFPTGVMFWKLFFL